MEYQPGHGCSTSVATGRGELEHGPQGLGLEQIRENRAIRSDTCFHALCSLERQGDERSAEAVQGGQVLESQVLKGWVLEGPER